MKRVAKVVLVGVLMVCGGTGEGFAIWPFSKGESKGAVEEKVANTTVRVDDTPLKRSADGVLSFAPVVEKVAPSVVSIVADRMVMQGGGVPYFFNQMVPQGPSKVSGVGSGIIVSEDGYILTNNHVVDKASNIKVSLGEGDAYYDARVVGTDPKTDVAVLKIQAEGLGPATFGDSDEVKVGDLVFAIGSPFALSRTVTMGIVSALGRDDVQIMPEDGYEFFIQTDASINRGNSGGPLVDAVGRVIGLNTAIFSNTGGNQGVGFAAPINLVRNVMEQIIEKGRVVRGFLGVAIQDLTPDLAESFGQDAGMRGALVGGVVPGSPAAKADLKSGDIITKLNGEAVSNASLLRLAISQMAPGKEVELGILRRGKKMKRKVRLAELPSDQQAPALPDEEEPSASDVVLGGVELVPLETKSRQQLNIPEHVKGALVKDVENDTPPAVAGIRPGDVIQEVQHEVVATPAEVAAVLKRQKGLRGVVVNVWREGTALFIFIPLNRDKEPGA